MRNRWLGLVIAAVALAVSVWAWPRLPARVPTHWNVHGVPDGYSSRLAAALIVPPIVVAMNGLFRILPRLDPRRVNYAKFQDTYWLIANAVALFLLGKHVLVMVNGLGYPVAMSRLMPRSEEHTSELQSHHDLVCRLLLEKKKKKQILINTKKKKKKKKN